MFSKEVLFAQSMPKEEEKAQIFSKETITPQSPILIPNKIRSGLGIFSKERIIDQDLFKEVFPNGYFEKVNKYGRSKVSRYPSINPEFYIKRYPEFPLFEYASTSLMRLLGLKHAPRSELFIFFCKLSLIKKDIEPFLVIQAVPGMNLHDALIEFPNCLDNLDHSHTARLILCSMLINPEDGKDDNFIISEDFKRLIPIDNDHCFMPSSTPESTQGVQKLYRNVLSKTIIYCLKEMMKPLPKDVYDEFLNMNVDKILEQWLHDLKIIEQELIPYFAINSIQKKFRNGKDDHCIIEFLFANQFIEDIYFKFKTIQELLASTSNITPMDLLERVEPYLWKKYKEAFKENHTTRERFDHICQLLYKSGNSSNKAYTSVLTSRTMVQIIEKSWLEDENAPKCNAIIAYNKLEQLRKEWLNKDILPSLKFPALIKRFVFFSNNEVLALERLKQNDTLPDVIALHNSKSLVSTHVANFLEEKGNEMKSFNVKILDLRNALLLDQTCSKIFRNNLKRLIYLNLSGAPKISKFDIYNWYSLKRLSLNSCNNLKFVGISQCIEFCLLEVKNCPSLDWVLIDEENMKMMNIDNIKYDVGFNYINIIEADNRKLIFKSRNSSIHELKSMLEMCIEHWTKLESLVIQNYEGEHEPFESKIKLFEIVLPEFINKSCLKSLKLLNSQIDEKMISYFLKGFPLKKLSKLVELDLSSNIIKNFNEIAGLIGLMLPNLLKLNLSNNKLDDVTFISRLENSQIVILDIQGNFSIKSDNVIDIFERDTKNRIKILNCIYDDNNNGFSKVTELLHLDHLIEFDLNNIDSNHEIWNEFCLLLSKTRLKKFSLNNCKLSSFMFSILLLFSD